MEKCLYDGKVLYAYQVLRDFEFEQKIRKCQTLTCCDCGASVFFRHGKQRAECFAHRHKEKCRYGDYCKKQSDIFKFIQRQLAPIMEKIATKHGFQLEEDVVIIQDHYTAFVIKTSSKKYAVDIIDYAATSSTLEKRKNLYEEQGYLYLQITVDKDVEEKPFSEREMAYFPVKFILNKSLNNTAIVIDEVQRKWSIYILDKTDLSEGVSGNPSWLENDTLAMPISIDEIDINSSGFYSLDSYKAYLDFCTQRKNRRESWFKAEHDHKDRQRKLAEESCKLAELVTQATMQQRETDEKAEIRRIHKLSGGYVGTKVRGEYEIFTLEQIATNRPSRNWLNEYTQQDFESYISEMQQFKYFGARMLFAKMCFITPMETSILLNLWSTLKTSDPQTADAIEFLMCKAGIHF